MANLPSDSPGVLDAANQGYDAVRDGLVNKGTPQWIAVALAAVVWAALFTLSTLRLALSFALKDVALPIALEIIRVIVSIRESGGQEFAQIAASVMGEFLGIEIDPGTIAPGQGPAAAAQRASTIGSSFLDMLAGSLQGSAPIDASDGEVNAKRFVGYGINFAVTNALMSIIAEMVSDDHLTQLHELGDSVARDIGLGRLIRRAVQPQINASITVPYTRFTNAKYRPKELSVGEYLTGLNAARMAEQDVTRSLTELGFSDEYIAELKLQHLPKLQLHEVDALIRWGKLDQAGGVAALVAQGWPEAHAQQKLDALHLAEADRQERTYVDEILRLAQERMLDTDTFANLLGRTHMSDEEKQGFANRLGVFLDSHHKALTLNELIFLQERNLITGEEVTAWTEQQGYSPNDAAMIELYVTEKVLEFEDAQKKKAAKAAAAAAKKKPPQPPPQP